MITDELQQRDKDRLETRRKINLAADAHHNSLPQGSAAALSATKPRDPAISPHAQLAIRTAGEKLAASGFFSSDDVALGLSKSLNLEEVARTPAGKTLLNTMHQAMDAGWTTTEEQKAMNQIMRTLALALPPIAARVEVARYIDRIKEPNGWIRWLGILPYLSVSEDDRQAALSAMAHKRGGAYAELYRERYGNEGLPTAPHPSSAAPKAFGEQTPRPPKKQRASADAEVLVQQLEKATSEAERKTAINLLLAQNPGALWNALLQKPTLARNVLNAVPGQVERLDVIPLSAFSDPVQSGALTLENIPQEVRDYLRQRLRSHPPHEKEAAAVFALRFGIAGANPENKAALVKTYLDKTAYRDLTLETLFKDAQLLRSVGGDASLFDNVPLDLHLRRVMALAGENRKNAAQQLAARIQRLNGAQGHTLPKGAKHDELERYLKILTVFMPKQIEVIRADPFLGSVLLPYIDRVQGAWKSVSGEQRRKVKSTATEIEGLLQESKGDEARERIAELIALSPKEAARLALRHGQLSAAFFGALSKDPQTLDRQLQTIGTPFLAALLLHENEGAVFTELHPDLRGAILARAQRDTPHEDLEIAGNARILLAYQRIVTFTSAPDTDIAQIHRAGIRAEFRDERELKAALVAVLNAPHLRDSAAQDLTIFADLDTPTLLAARIGMDSAKAMPATSLLSLILSDRLAATPSEGPQAEILHSTLKSLPPTARFLLAGDDTLATQLLHRGMELPEYDLDLSEENPTELGEAHARALRTGKMSRSALLQSLAVVSQNPEYNFDQNWKHSYATALLGDLESQLDGALLHLEEANAKIERWRAQPDAEQEPSAPTVVFEAQMTLDSAPLNLWATDDLLELIGTDATQQHPNFAAYRAQLHKLKIAQLRTTLLDPNATHPMQRISTALMDGGLSNDVRETLVRDHELFALLLRNAADIPIQLLIQATFIQSMKERIQQMTFALPDLRSAPPQDSITNPGTATVRLLKVFSDRGQALDIFFEGLSEDQITIWRNAVRTAGQETPN